MRDFMATINATMELDNTGVPMIQRQHDAHIMDLILDSDQFTPMQIRRLNYCRLYLQAVTISDLTDATGEILNQMKMRGVPDFRSSTTTWILVNQDRPSELEWRLWRKANLLWSTVSGILHTSLGQWLHQRPLQRHQHFAYLYRKRHQSCIYVRISQDQYQVGLPTGHPGEFRFQPRIRRIDAIKATAHPVSILASPLNPDHWEVQPVMHSIVPAPTSERSETFADFIDTLEPWETDVLRMTTLHVDPNAVCEALSHGFRAASDGSVRFSTQGSFGWASSTDQGIQAATGMGPARGPRPSSYRAKGYGLLSILRSFIRLAEFTGRFYPWTGILVTDSQSVLKTLAGVTASLMPPTSPFKSMGPRLFSTSCAPIGTFWSKSNTH